MTPGCTSASNSSIESGRDGAEGRATDASGGKVVVANLLGGAITFARGTSVAASCTFSWEPIEMNEDSGLTCGTTRAGAALGGLTSAEGAGASGGFMLTGIGAGAEETSGTAFSIAGACGAADAAGDAVFLAGSGPSAGNKRPNIQAGAA